jgi:predicted permease
VNVLFPQILRGFPDAKLTQDNQARLTTAHVELTNMARGFSNLRGAYSEPLKILMTIVALVLLIACANIANLLLARSTARARELAVRQALGARRSRLIRQLLTESLMLALAGGALGIGLATLANRLLLRMITNGSGSVSLDVSLNLRLLAFTFAITVSTALLFGTLPAFRATRLHLTESLKSGRGGLSAASRTPVAKVLVVGQVALSLTLMVAACLFLRTLVNLNKVDTGFNKQNVLRLDIDDDNLGSQDNTALFRQIEERVSTLPGVQAASFSDFTFHQSGWMTGVRVPGMPVNTSLRNIKHNKVGDAYFKVMQIPLLAGRTFGPQDTPTSPRVAIISENMARHLFPPGSPIGRSYFIGSEGSSEPLQQVQVIGVARDVKFGDLGEPLNYIDYLANSQGGGWFTDFEVRYTGDFGVASRAVQEAIHSVDRRLLISKVTTLEEQVARSYTNQTVIAELSAFFAVVAVFLSCIGLYGLMSYLVSRRTGEIGIRMALGAPRSGVAWQVLREIGLMVLAGIMIGLPVTLGGSRVVHNMLYGISGTDPLSLTVAILLLLFAGLASGYVPARRASRVDPAVALRDE